MSQIKRTSEITIQVGLDTDNNPETIHWNATDSGFTDPREVKSFMLALWDKKENNSMRVELWNKEMQVNEMYTFIYQSVVAMSDTMERATNDRELADDMRDFAAFFAKKAGLIS